MGGSALLWLLYASVFAITQGPRGLTTVVDAAANVGPLVLLTAAVHRFLSDVLVRWPVHRQIVLHVLMAPVFALAWYSMVAVLLGFIIGMRGGDYAPFGFSGPAATWQLFQGLILYALVAAICYAIRGGREAAQVTIVDSRDAPLNRYLVKDGDGLRPIDVADIVSITGAQDYAEVTMRGDKHLVRMSLGEFERLLDPARFVRVHRSAIINLDHLCLAEPAGGGRMIARMNSGPDVQVSRAGAACLKKLVA
ncbi:LytTR family DNA-binding domain-containing protein [Erythrobacter sp. JK5]|uniref:LytR/AlgR family response regulator transcription factor n=1 Tax=Erythrobacter sp. JK5 TaxID=2829500 RepID=UPI001BABA5D6|nr:LytTR family DNA-binding domain-containing protein [Erythrobacter sp. JK5]QUL36748.1 LytTR family transcriptional regulator [Erythrobacter sp. JK5]